MSQPARGAADREQHREHLDGKAHRLVDETGVEIDVRVELAVDEVAVAEGNLFELQRNVEARVLAGDVEDVVGSVLDDRGAGVVVLVHPVTEAHQTSLAGLDALDKGGNVVEAADVVEHVEHRFVGTAVARAVERSGGCGDRAVGIGMGGSNNTGGRGGAVLLMIGVENQEDFHRLVQRRVDLVRVADLEHHVQEVRRVIERVVGEDVGQTHGVAVRRGGHGWHLGDQPHDLFHADVRIVDVFGFGVEGRKTSDAGGEQPHRMRVVVVRVVHPGAELLVKEGVVGDLVDPRIVLRLGGELAVDQQVADLEEGRVLRQLLDRVAAVAQDAVLAVEFGDGAVGARRGGEAGIVEPDAWQQLAPLGGIDAAVVDRDLERLTGPIVGDGDALCHGAPALYFAGSTPDRGCRTRR